MVGIGKIVAAGVQEGPWGEGEESSEGGGERGGGVFRRRKQARGGGGGGVVHEGVESCSDKSGQMLLSLLVSHGCNFHR